MCSVAAENDSEATQAFVLTSNQDSSAFVLEANQIDAVALKVQQRPNTSGTLTVILRNSTAGTNVASVVVDVADLEINGWHVFPLGLNHTPNGTDSYVIRVVESVTSQVAFYVSSGTNWTRQVRRTATQAPGVNDKLLIAGEHTGAGTGNSFTVTMNNTATTSFGPTVSGGPPQGISINKRATLTFSTSIAAYLKWKGVFAVYGGGTLNVGTSGARIGASSSAILEMDSVANVDTGLVAFPGSTVNMYGDNSRLTNTFLNTDESAASTVIGLVATTGWAVSDELAFASTTRTNSECEKKTILTVDSPTQVTLTAGLTNAHSGTFPTQAEVINLTRNVKVRGVSALLQGYCLFQTTSVVNIDYAEFTQLGSGTNLKRGIDSQTITGGACSLTHCSLHDSTISSVGFNILGTSGNGVVFSNNVTFNISNTHVNFLAASSGTWVIDSNVMMLSTTASTNIVFLGDVGGTFTNNTMVGGTSIGLSISEAAALGTFSGNVTHSNGSFGGQITSITGGTFGTYTAWRNGNTGLDITSATGVAFPSLVGFGNGTSTLQLRSTSSLVFTDFASNGDTTFATPMGVSTTTSTTVDIIFESANLGTVSGIKTAHTGADINCGATYVTWTLRNCILASITEVTAQSSIFAGSYIRAQKLDQTAGNDKSWGRYGTISLDTTIFDAASPSIRLAPNNASNKLATDGGAVDQGGAFFVPVASGNTVTVSVRVRKSVAGDGTAYNGNLPRLILRKNVAAGIAADAVLATATAASVGAWETISGTTAAVTDDAVLALVVDCDGTTGWCNVDGFSALGPSTKNGNFWSDGAPFLASGGEGSARTRTEWRARR